MFREMSCGCIFSFKQGRVRICPEHRPERATGDGAADNWAIKGKPKLYPAHGTCVPGWSGK